MRVRDGVAAFQYASALCTDTNWKDAECFEAYAATLAENGNFPDAVRWQEKAIAAPDLLEGVSGGYEEQVYTKAQQRLALYKRGLPFRDPRFPKQ